MSAGVPAVAGILSRDQVAATAGSIARMQEADGALPWTTGGHTDTWNHVEAAMALLVGGEAAAAHRAYDWCLATQREDGTWARTVLAGVVDDAGTETNMTAYLAVGVWHHWLVRRDDAFLRRCWPAVRRALDVVASLQLPFGGIAWARDAAGTAGAEALLTGSSSTFHALRAGVALSELVGDPQPGWELAAGRLRHALRRHRDAFLDKRAYSMDWYYPVLGGAVRGDEGRALLERRWDDFVVPGLGVLCVATNPWVTGAETCELVLALDALGDRRRARGLLADMQHLRDDDGGYWTGYVYPDDAHWPAEHTTYTAAAVVLAADALSDTTPGAGLFRGGALPSLLPGTGRDCGCEPALAGQNRPR
jgi:hypothetical protein